MANCIFLKPRVTHTKPMLPTASHCLIFFGLNSEWLVTDQVYSSHRIPQYHRSKQLITPFVCFFMIGICKKERSRDKSCHDIFHVLVRKIFYVLSKMLQTKQILPSLHGSCKNTEYCEENENVLQTIHMIIGKRVRRIGLYSKVVLHVNLRRETANRHMGGRCSETESS